MDRLSSDNTRNSKWKFIYITLWKFFFKTKPPFAPIKIALEFCVTIYASTINLSKKNNVNKLIKKIVYFFSANNKKFFLYVNNGMLVSQK